MGGSTNAVLHLLAIAREAGVELTIDDFDRISSRTPLIADLKPGGRFVANDLYKAGGIQLIVKRLVDGDLIYADAMTVTGKTMRFGPGKKTDAYVIQWSKPDETISWSVRVAQPATFSVATLYDAGGAGGTYSVKVGSQSLSGTVKQAKLQQDSLGTVKLEPGTYPIQIVPEKIAGEELMNLRTLILTPEAK